jgi:hypothetical protein
MNTIESEWLDFKNRVISKNAPDIQISEMKLAFYAGANTSFSLMFGPVASASDDAAEMLLRSLQQELLDFLENITKVKP